MEKIIPHEKKVGNTVHGLDLHLEKHRFQPKKIQKRPLSLQVEVPVAWPIKMMISPQEMFRIPVDGRNPSPVEVGSLSPSLKGFMHPRW